MHVYKRTVPSTRKHAVSQNVQTIQHVHVHGRTCIAYSQNALHIEFYMELRGSFLFSMYSAVDIELYNYSIYVL